jgi:serine/threonine protein kinase
MFNKNIYLYHQKEEKEDSSSSCLKNFSIMNKIGSGGYSQVYEIQHKKTKKNYALKTISKKFIQTNRKEHQVFVEKMVLQNLKDSRIVELRMTLQDNNNIYFVLELVSKKSLADILKDKLLEESTAVSFIAEIVNIIEVLQNQGISHRDLKPENLLLDSSNHLKLIDFGTACIFKQKNKNNELYYLYKDISKKFKNKYSKKLSLLFGENESEKELPNWRLSETVGTSFFISPESINCSSDLSGCDFWSLGVIIFKMLTGYYPFQGENEEEIFSNILNNNYQLPPFLSDSAKDLIQKLLVLDPEQRLGNGKIKNTFEDLKSHPFFEKNNLYKKIHLDEENLAKKNHTLPINISSSAFLLNENQILLETKIKYRKIFFFWVKRTLVLYKDGRLVIKNGNIIEQEILINHEISTHFSKSKILIKTTFFKSFEFFFDNNNYEKWFNSIKSFF